MQKTLAEKWEEETIFLQNKMLLLKKFPDLSEYRGRWESFLQSAAVNSVDKDFGIDYRRSCGCCVGAVVYAMPYITFVGIKVFTNPAQIPIGEGNSWGTGIVPYCQWRDANISDAMKWEIDKYLEENEPQYYED